MRYIHAMEYYLAFKKKEVQIHAITQMNLEDIVLSERTSHKRPHIVLLQ